MINKCPKMVFILQFPLLQVFHFGVHFLDLEWSQLLSKLISWKKTEPESQSQKEKKTNNISTCVKWFEIASRFPRKRMKNDHFLCVCSGSGLRKSVRWKTNRKYIRMFVVRLSVWHSCTNLHCEINPFSILLVFRWARSNETRTIWIYCHHARGNGNILNSIF